MHIHTLSENVGSLVLASDNPDLFSLETGEVIDGFRETGAIVFKGFGANVKDFEAFTNRFSDQYMDNAGSGSYRQTVNLGSDGTIQNVAYQFGVNTQLTWDLPLHADRSYLKSQPPVMWFMCEHPAASGGQTTVCDGVRVREALSEATRKLFETRPIKYIRQYNEEHWQLFYHTKDLDDVRAFCADNDLSLKVNADNSIETEYVTPAIVDTRWGGHKAFVNSILIVQWQEDDLDRKVSFVRFEDGSRIPDDVIAEVKEVTESLTENIEWEKGDLAVVDNTRMLHGRRSFSDPDRSIYVRMCRQVDW